MINTLILASVMLVIATSEAGNSCDAEAIVATKKLQALFALDESLGEDRSMKTKCTEYGSYLRIEYINDRGITVYHVIIDPEKMELMEASGPKGSWINPSFEQEIKYDICDKGEDYVNTEEESGAVRLREFRRMECENHRKWDASLDKQ